ncbi:MAG: Rap1a/Tai family immunity protein [Pseudomonadota bacterium]
MKLLDLNMKPLLSRSFLIGITVAALITPAEADQLKVSDVSDMRAAARAGDFKARVDWNALSYYLQGAMEAIALAQNDLERADKTPLFCPPKGKSFEMQDVYAMLERVSDPNQPALEAVMATLKTRYPCS